jgi:hypothetical protein
MTTMSARHLLRRLVAITLLVVMAPVAYAAATCVGWSGSAAERMACCQRQGTDHPSASADDCCAAGEQRQNVETAVVVVVMPAVTVWHAAPALAPPPQSFLFDPRSLAERPDTYLLDSVFRI